jgi:hypothetical protein
MVGRRPIFRQVADEGDHQHRDDVAHHRDPQVHALVEADAVGRLHRVGRAEDGGDHRDHVHQGHEHHQHHVLPAVAEGFADRRLGHLVLFSSWTKAGVSCTSLRMMKPAISTTALIRNGMRQPPR